MSKTIAVLPGTYILCKTSFRIPIVVRALLGFGGSKILAFVCGLVLAGRKFGARVLLGFGGKKIWRSCVAWLWRDENLAIVCGLVLAGRKFGDRFLVLAGKKFGARVWLAFGGKKNLAFPPPPLLFLTD
jgi:hypothetical protein